MSLRDHLLRRIQIDGPISMADFMTDALQHPQHGYYTTRDPLGRAGDFTTAPEISQMFGELIGLSLAQCWLDQGSPSRFTLAELGPGRGTLMKDALRAASQVPGFDPTIILVETSRPLRAVQKETLADHTVTWVDTVTALPDGPLFLIANEFFDALPIRQFKRAGPGWQEIRIGAEHDTLTFGLAQAQAHPALDHRLEDTQDGDIVELCSAAETITAHISTHIAQHGGAALVIDYGDWRSLGDTVQAIKDHDHISPLECPGDADLTAHVDFEAIARTTAPAKHTRITPQGVFLERLGITPRAQALSTRLRDEALSSHIAAHRRLTHPSEMGNLFKVLGIYPDSASPPPGLEP